MSFQQDTNHQWVNYTYRPFTRFLTPALINSHLPLALYPLFALLLAVMASLCFSFDGYFALLLGSIIAFGFGAWELASEEVYHAKQRSFAQNWYANLMSRYSETLMLLGLTLHLYDDGSKNLIFIGGLAIVGSLIYYYSSSRFFELNNHLPSQGNETAIGQSIRWLIISIGGMINLPILVLLIMAIFYNAAVIRRMVLWSNK